MITSLTIQNFALIEKNEIHFQQGLNIITGESGAGKSILVNAINQLCGERSNFDFIKTGAKKSVLETEIDLSQKPEIKLLLQQNEIEVNDTLIIRKEISQSGSSRIFLNDTPVQLAVLNSISSHLIDLHGQHQHQVLLHPENHLPYLDTFAGMQNTVKDFAVLVKNYDSLKKKIKKLAQEQANALQMTDLYNLQREELQNANLVENELELMKDELKVLSNFEKIHHAANILVNNLTEDETNASKLISAAENEIVDLAQIDSQFEELSKNLSSARSTIEEISQFTERYLSGLEFDPKRTDFLRERIAYIDFLLKKYQKTDLAGLFQLKEELSQKLEEIGNFDKQIGRAHV